MIEDFITHMSNILTSFSNDNVRQRCQLRVDWNCFTLTASFYNLISLVDLMIQPVSTQERGSHLSAVRQFVLTQKHLAVKATKSKV